MVATSVIILFLSSSYLRSIPPSSSPSVPSYKCCFPQFSWSPLRGHLEKSHHLSSLSVSLQDRAEVVNTVYSCSHPPGTTLPFPDNASHPRKKIKACWEEFPPLSSLSWYNHPSAHTPHSGSEQPLISPSGSLGLSAPSDFAQIPSPGS